MSVGRAIPARLPGLRFTCRACGCQIVFARTVRSETGAGGKFMPLNPVPDSDGNVAVREAGRGLRARVLCKDERHDVHNEVLAMPHAATCTKALAINEGVGPARPVDELAARRARKAGRS